MKLHSAISFTRVVALALILMVSAFAPATPAVADGTGPLRSNPSYPEMSGPGIITYDVSKLPPLANSRRQVVLGALSSKGCIASHDTPRVQSAPGAPVPVIRELAYDPVGCRYLEEVGTIRAEAAVSLAPQPTPVAAMRLLQSASPYLSGYQYGRQYSVQWYDPIGIEVSHADIVGPYSI